MTQNAHDQTRKMIAAAGGEELSEAQRSSLRAHLEMCAACRDYADVAGSVVRSLRSLSVAADSRLVRATQMRVRFHASRMRETRERMWLVGIACGCVGVSTAFTAPLLWRLFAWTGEWAGISTSVWQAGFLFFCIAPALVAGVVLLARGLYAGDHRGNSGLGK